MELGALSSLSELSARAAPWIPLALLAAAVLLPAAFSHWRPLLLRWAGRRRALRDRLIAEGVIEPAEAETARFVRVREVAPRGARRRRQEAFLILGDGTLRLAGPHWCASASRFRVTPASCRCETCRVLWSCGGEGFRLHLEGTGAGEFVVSCLEGRTLRDTARATAMLEGLVESHAAPCAS